MKKLFFILFILLLSSCSKMDIENDPYFAVDWAPVTLTIVVSDDEGHDLVHPDLEGVSITFKGKTYQVQTLPGVDTLFPDTKYYFATAHGLFVQKSPYTDHAGHRHEYRLIFGDIDGSLDMEEDLIFTWKDKKPYTIHYSCSEHIYGPYPRVTRIWTINGKRTELPIEINI